MDDLVSKKEGHALCDVFENFTSADWYCADAERKKC